MGAQAITYCHLAAGRTDAVVCLKPSRSVDVAAAQLLVLEQGLAIHLVDGGTLGEHPLDLVGRSRFVAAATPELCAQLAAAI
jgi:fructose-1,6-bisphosphatase/inositol monophosphatase family enzyme